jgi:hypothetical protein
MLLEFFISLIIPVATFFHSEKKLNVFNAGAMAAAYGSIKRLL